MSQRLDEMMKLLGKAYELERPVPKLEESVYALPIDEEGRRVRISEANDSFSFHAAVAPVPVNECETYFQHLLLADLFNQGTQGCVLGLDLEEKFITISFDCSDSVDYKEFKVLLEEFIGMVDLWEDLTREYVESPKDALFK